MLSLHLPHLNLKEIKESHTNTNQQLTATASGGFQALQHLQDDIWPSSFCLLQRHMRWEVHAAPSIHIYSHMLMCRRTQSPFPSCTKLTNKYISPPGTQSHASAHRRTVMFSSSTPKSAGEETDPDEHMVAGAVMDGREHSTWWKQKEAPEIQGWRGSRFFTLTVCFPPDAAWQTTPALYRDTFCH